ncbi:MAG: hypothetical protein CSA11_01020 [Chloroflexi bacterium]|nr:MAG: hypothetical protein CSA11_01020 [Chloroflexota bacterium]
MTMLSAYLYVTKVELKNQTRYATETIIRSSLVFMILLIYLQLWSYIYSLDNSQMSHLLPKNNMLWYMYLVVVAELGRFRPGKEIETDVVTGNIAYLLNRPYAYLLYQYFKHAAGAIFRTVMALVFGLGLVLLHTREFISISGTSLLIFCISYIFAQTIDFLIHAIIGIAAFVLEETNILRLLCQKLVFLIGGLFFPLDFLPTFLQNISAVLPFRLTTYAPAIILANFANVDVANIIQSQIIWILILMGCLMLLYRIYSARVTINGG